MTRPPRDALQQHAAILLGCWPNAEKLLSQRRPVSLRWTVRSLHGGFHEGPSVVLVSSWREGVDIDGYNIPVFLNNIAVEQKHFVAGTALQKYVALNLKFVVRHGG